jgi:hypothetical protein
MNAILRRFFFVALVAAAGCAPRDAQQDRPVVEASPAAPAIELTDSAAFRLSLPTAMVRVLHDSVPGFEPWSMDHYDPDVRKSYFLSFRSVPSAVIGDFNGDGIPDVAIDGRTGTEAITAVLLSERGGYRFIVIRRTGFNAVTAVRGRSIEYLAFQPPGKIGPGQTADSLMLRTDAFEYVWDEKAALLYYWTGKEFKQWQTSD